MQKKFGGVILFLVLFSSYIFGQSPRYIFLFIGDGMGNNQRRVAEEVSMHAGLGKLEMNHFPVVGTTYTASANNRITDSAAAVTAIACGVKTNNGMLGVSPDEKPLVSIAADARNAGWKVGIITSVPLNHATPAGFYAHVVSRKMYDDIAMQMAASGFDFFGGAGVIWKGGGDIYAILAQNGYATAIGLDALRRLAKTPAVAVEHVGDGQMSPRYAHNNAAYKSTADVMTLADLTANAVRLLDNPVGFFIMVEGGAIDWACHDNDLPDCIWETIAMNDAVRVAMDFARKHPNETLIITTADHETGGLTVQWPIDVQKIMKLKSPSEIQKILLDCAKQKTGENLFAMLDEKFGLKNLSDDDKAVIQKFWDSGQIAGKHGVALEVLRLTYANVGISWTTGAHTGKPVTTTAVGPTAEKLFGGEYQNTHIAEAVRSIIKQPAAVK
ncbi:MAG TPA: alkaline phosphatase [Phycisphaerae bacterium]|nr:alkaline phosphatase [Phycisphaerae bacterium]